MIVHLQLLVKLELGRILLFFVVIFEHGLF